ncbi:MAG: peptide methionine sulfoxide reductase MsrB [Bacillariaceae sp.]|jgi:peptide methionine sulfoxide reductase MsrB
MKLLNLTMLSVVGTSLLRSSSAFGPAAFSRTSAASTNATQRNMFNRLFGANTISSEYPIMAEESVMSQKGHGTSQSPVQKELRWNCDNETADRICNFNRHYAEFGGYWESTTFLSSVKDTDQPINFYDSVTGELLFKAPIGRTMDEFVKESKSHGWPSFRDEEVVWDHVRCLKNGECISDSGTHLGHNLPDGSGNRYCINLVSVAGQSKDE